MSYYGSYHTYLQDRLAFARRVGEGVCGGSYGDAILILSAILSSLAADLWPGERKKDRLRFVEIWAIYSPPELTPNLISVPLLLDSLEKKGHHDLVEKVCGTHPQAFPPHKEDKMVVTGEDVDKTEDDLLALDPELATKRLREFSYGNVFYRHVRSGYTHSYHTTEYASSVPIADETRSVSYINRHDLSYRPIYFSMSWLADLIESVLVRVMALGGNQPLPDPQTWWVAGRPHKENL